nr:transposase zinc-binding domain-containing protein [Klebsiella pneumoniae]UPG21285.1 transposase zinc-binding domain-containing protein [Klebsiella pneumoniae]
MCEHCRAERLVAFSCKKRGFCPSCGARRMAESARHRVGRGGVRPAACAAMGAELSVPPCVSCSPASQKPLARCWASCSA